MNRDQERLQERREFVKKTVWKSRNTDKTVKKIAKKLFLSERTIYKDLTY